jgi:hypothetical protein
VGSRDRGSYGGLVCRTISFRIVSVELLDLIHDSGCCQLINPGQGLTGPYDLNVPSESIAPRTTWFKACIWSVTEGKYWTKDLRTSAELISFKWPLGIDDIKPQEMNLGLETIFLSYISWVLFSS